VDAKILETKSKDADITKFQRQFGVTKEEAKYYLTEFKYEDAAKLLANDLALEKNEKSNFRENCSGKSSKQKTD